MCHSSAFYVRKVDLKSHGTTPAILKDDDTLRYSEDLWNSIYLLYVYYPHQKMEEMISRWKKNVCF